MLKNLRHFAAAVSFYAIASPAFSQDIVAKLLSQSTPISEEYRQKFYNCDNNNMFRGLAES